MSSEQNWRQENSAETYFGHQKKTLAVADRRPVIRKASDLVGPGIGASATVLTDFNDLLATYNGYYSAEDGALNAPFPGEAYVGIVVMDSMLGGYQKFTGMDTQTEYRRMFYRNPSDPESIFFDAWQIVWTDPVAPVSLLSSRYHAVAQAIPTGTDTTVQFSTAEENDIPYSAGIWTVPLDGRYLCSATIQWAGSAATVHNRYFSLFYDSTIMRQEVGPSTNLNMPQSVAMTLRLDAGQTVKFVALHTAGATVNINGTTSKYTSADVTYLGP